MEELAYRAVVIKSDLFAQYIIYLYVPFKENHTINTNDLT
jgi:hypothetical protein